MHVAYRAVNADENWDGQYVHGVACHAQGEKALTRLVQHYANTFEHHDKAWMHGQAEELPQHLA